MFSPAPSGGKKDCRVGRAKCSGSPGKKKGPGFLVESGPFRGLLCWDCRLSRLRYPSPGPNRPAVSMAEAGPLHPAPAAQAAGLSGPADPATGISGCAACIDGCDGRIGRQVATRIPQRFDQSLHKHLLISLTENRYRLSHNSVNFVQLLKLTESPDKWGLQLRILVLYIDIDQRVSLVTD